MTSRFLAALQALRPREWVKNLFVLAPLIFAGAFMEGRRLRQSVAALIAFCIAASVVYLINDLVDREVDGRNPAKAHRPVASKRLSPRVAVAIVVVLELILPAIAGWTGKKTLLVILGYQAVNLLYSGFLKHIPVVDLFCVASGFVFRVLAGAVAISVPLSFWMLNTTLCLALYLATIKRRQEALLMGSAGRSVLRVYTVELLDYYAFFAAVLAVVFYGMFVLTVRPSLEMTLPIVIFGFFRYRFVVVTRQAGESPTDLVLGDWPLAATILAWGVLCVVAMIRQF